MARLCIVCFVAAFATGCAEHMPEPLVLEGGDDDAPPRPELPKTDDPCTRGCYDDLLPVMKAPPVDCDDPAIPRAGCFQPPSVREVVGACAAICRYSTPIEDCPELVAELRNLCMGPCAQLPVPDLQASCRRGCVRTKFGPVLPECTQSRLFR